MDPFALSWLGIIAFGVIMYVILDGFGLGVGLLSPLFTEHEKDLIVSTILPVWDGNETWLVFVGAALYGAFPLAFSTVLPAFYIPILIMVIALLFRGASFEFRLKSYRSKIIWNSSFFLGSLFVTIAQGLIVAGLLTGFVLPTEYASFSFHEWFTPFGLFCALSLIMGYALLGSNRLIIKTTGVVQQKCYKLSKILQFILVVCGLIIVFWTQAIDPEIKHIWFNSARTVFFAICLVIGIIFYIGHFISLNKRFERGPFWFLIGLFLVAYTGFILSIFPYIIPHHLTYLQAAAGDSTLKFMLVGAVIMLPILLYYTYYSYKIFRGKTHEKIEY